MTNLYIKCSFCHRDTINYKEGNFFLLNFKEIEKNENSKIREMFSFLKKISAPETARLYNYFH